MRRVVLFLLILFVACAPAAPTRQPFLSIQAHGDTWQVIRVNCYGFPEMLPWQDPFKHCLIDGWTEESTHTVYVLDDLSPTEEKITVVHELMHVAVGTGRSTDRTTIHDAIYDISEELAPILTDNPSLLAYLGSER